jgi:hypothetical protein
MDIAENIAEKVHQLKSSFTVEGTPLFRSDRFTEDEIAQMKRDSTCHSSHWNGFGKNDKVWSDEEIATQIEVFFATPMMNETKFKDIVNSMLKALPIEDKRREKQVFKDLLYGILNWTKEKNGISLLWRKFGSAPSAKDNKFHGNKLLEKYAKKYGACSMGTIFDDQFSDKFHIFWYGANNALQEFESYWDEAKRKKDLKAQEFSSPYKDLNDIEENVVMKKIPEAAKMYYMDKSKPFNERVTVFSVHGKEAGFIHEPTDSDLAKIFKIYYEGGWLDRYQTVECAEVLESWMQNLRSNRCHLNWSNPYHPELEKEKRNYIPSEEAIQRLYKYYMEKVFLDEIGSFEFDW